MTKIKVISKPQVQSFAYDTLDRLTSADTVGGLNGLYAETYTYDPLTSNLASKAGNTYTYGDTSHAHEVTGLSNGNAYTYDANGDQVTRVVGTDSYTHVYDAENKVIQVVKNGNTLAEFIYDGDGTRVVSTINGPPTNQARIVIARYEAISVYEHRDPHCTCVQRRCHPAEDANQ